ncbi:GTPase-activating protein [Alternaria alternata]|nr:GTPase-activating protein [Alternaria alternata]
MASKKQQQVCPPDIARNSLFANNLPGNGPGRFVSFQTTKSVIVSGVANISLPCIQTGPRTLLQSRRIWVSGTDISCAARPLHSGAQHPTPLAHRKTRRSSAHPIRMPTYTTSAHCMLLQVLSL